MLQVDIAVGIEDWSPAANRLELPMMFVIHDMLM
jgi:hypothetical protein